MKRLLVLGIGFGLLLMPALTAKENQAPKKKQYAMQALTDYDMRVLENGRVEGARRVFGSLLAVFPGFGVGHAVQGRYLNKGLIFTLTEAGSVAVMFGSTGEGGAVMGFAGLLGLKIWEFVDSLVGPVRDNRRYDLLQAEIAGTYERPVQLMPVPLVKHEASGRRTTHLGLALTWDIP